MLSEEQYTALRKKMVETQLQDRGIRDVRVLTAMLHVPRHAFVPPELREQAYEDGPLPIGDGQTISQPYIVAAMSEMLLLEGTEHVLEIGTGSGYQAAVLAELAREVFSVERHPALAQNAQRLLRTLGYGVQVYIGDGTQGLTAQAPFDAILVTAASPHVPGPLCAQLRREGGRLVLPVGDRERQDIQRVTRQGKQLYVETLTPVRFVPLIGQYGWRSSLAEGKRHDADEGTDEET